MVKQEIKSFLMDCGEHKGLQCTVPCTMYSVLLENKLIDDPTVSDKALTPPSFCARGCIFTAEFEVTPLILSMKNVFLRFSGLDTLCAVELNGSEIGKTDNMHLTYDFDVKTKLHVGKNELKLVFTPAPQSSELRKSYFTFGTDSAPRLSDMGIFRKVEIVAFNHKIISDVKIRQTHTGGTVRLDLSIATHGYDDLSRAVATLTSPGGNVYFCGFSGGEGNMTVSDPNLWWPNGLGMQNLYKLNVNLYSDNELQDTYEVRIGLRTVALCKNGEGAPTLLVNDTPVLVMGGEYMSEDIILSRLSQSRTKALLENAKNANFNSILIHGSGYYPEEYFFDACDELGLLVFRELPVEDSAAEDSAEFCEKLKAEILANLTETDHHPSFCMVIGNDRVSRLFADDDEAKSFASAFCENNCADLFDYKGECKKHFVRIGYTSLPTYDAIKKFAEPSERNLGSVLFESHGAKADTVTDMLSLSLKDYPYPNGMSELSYVAGLTSAEHSMREADAVRRSSDRPLGIIMNRMNDSWPTLSPSAVDYYGGKKALHYFEREFFAPVRISAVRNGTRIKFIVSNDTRQDYVGVFAYQITDASNRPMFRDSFPIKARASANLEVHNVDIGSVINGHEQEYYLSYSVTDKRNEVSKGLLMFTNIKRFRFNKPNCHVELSGNGMEYLATVSSPNFVKGIEISFEEEDISVDKNYFDITGNAPVRVKLTAKRVTSIEKIRRIMKIRTVCDLGGDV